MERLHQLHIEYEANKKALAYPMNVSEYFELKERREAILAEARTLSANPNIRDFWS
jgi:hypothetical protein